MQLGYFKMLEVAYSLNSFSESQVFSFRPLAKTVKTLDRHGILFRTTEKGFVLLSQFRWESESDNYLPLRTLPADMKLSFGVNSTIEAIEHISKLPFHTPGRKIFYFDNLTQREEGGTLYLNSEAPTQKFVTENDLYARKPVLYSYSEKSESSAFFKIVDAKGNIVSAQNCIPFGKTGEKRITISHDFSDLPAGLYELIKESSSIEKFYVMYGNEGNFVGVIDLYAGSDVPEACSYIDSNGVPAPKTFVVNFEERQSIWRYHIVSKFDTEITASDLKIVDSKNGYTFSEPLESTTIAGEKAFVIKSVEEITVQEKVLAGIRLEVDKKPRITDLQNPDLNNITVENNTFYSDVYVYV